MPRHPDTSDLMIALSTTLDINLMYTRASLGDTAWCSVELRTGVDGDALELTWLVGTRGHDPKSLAVWGRGPNIDAAIDEALDEMPVRRPAAKRRRR